MKKCLAVLFSFFLCAASGKSIDEAISIPLGGIRQFITLHGADDSKPVLLFLHGGPGSSAMKYFNQFTGELQKKFIVVNWDQRETGRTKALNNSPLPLTVAQFENDVTELITYLTKRFHQTTVTLVGHSWGGFLALVVAHDYPGLLNSCFAVSPMVWQNESEKETLAHMKNIAEKEHNTIELSELQNVHVPFESGTDLYIHRKWLAELMKQKSFSKSFVEDWATKWLSLFKEASDVNLFITAPEIKCPVYFLVGDKDYQTWFELTARYAGKVKAPAKEIFWFAHSPHSFLVSQNKRLQEIILQKALPDNLN